MGAKGARLPHFGMIMANHYSRNQAARISSHLIDCVGVI